MRPSRDTFWFNLAAQYATRATCPRASMGAVLVKFDRPFGFGFNGAPEGEPHCLEDGETLAEHLALEHCTRTRHAEINALRNAWLPPFGATLYVWGNRPICAHCADRLREAGVTDIRHDYGLPSLDELAHEISAWGAATFTASTPESTAEHLRREAEELAADPINAEEMADVFHLLIQLARVTGTNLQAAVEQKFAINRERIWQAPDSAGVVEHVREVAR